MATATVLTTSAPEPDSRKEPNLLRKSPSLKSPPGLSPPQHITRRHSWTANTRQPTRDRSLVPTIMEASEARTFREAMPQSQDSLMSSKRAFSNTRAGATFDMAYFLRHTGPTKSASETAKESAKKPGRKKSRGIFKKKKESPDQEAPAAVRQSSTIFVPPEGVEQKVTARGHKYLQILPHPDLLDLGQAYSPRLFCNPNTEQTEVVSSDALDTWISCSLETRPHGEDLSVKPPGIDGMHAHECAESLPPSRPKTPVSCSTEARSVKRPPEGGFGLSIIDGHATAPYSNGAIANAALNSNPPSDPGSPNPGALHLCVYEENKSTEATEMPPLKKSINTDESKIFGVRPEAISAEEKEKFDRRWTDVLADQGPRSPGSDDVVTTEPETEPSPSAATQAHRSREAAARARKIKELQLAYRNIDGLVKDLTQNEEVGSSRDQALVESACDNDEAARATLRHQNQQTKTMVVAEQAPQPRNRPTRKPARLVLRDSSILENTTAVRADDGPGASSDGSPDAKVAPQPRASSSPQAPGIPTKSTARSTLTPTSGGVGARLHGRHHSTPLTPQAVTATANLAGGTRTSVCSSHTSHSREARLEARVEALERENRLLEAALLAVLKTSGTLNRCPCGVLKEQAERTPASRAPLTLSGTWPRAYGTELRKVSEEHAGAASAVHAYASTVPSSIDTRRDSAGSNGSGVSALEVYLRTKIGA
ncbi:uncharacterized protein PV09_00332 [Verruconis gallopava]|uniref:Uncharacterized protein n=1 Tax=Verruconis gallopava TaxID=253628 RepID=A0A0D1Z8Z5_9PEZI|nr:uncharacterized protein PV09_00332 [Verruconis gallopava]KIW09452.1 hypothetical protein PV09_00332 [Verruconis gallopava]